MKATWEVLRNKNPKVHWYKVVWFKDNTPKNSFITWLAFKDRMTTREILHRWGPVTENTCALCGEAMETMDRLFFLCPNVSQVWNNINRKCDLFGLSNN